MRTLTLAVVIAFVISSCKKDVDQNTPTPGAPTAGPTFVISSTFGNTSYVPPQTMTKIFEGKFSVGTREKFFIRGALMEFTTTGGAISNYKNLRYSLVKKSGSYAIAPALLTGSLSPTVTSTGVAPLDTGEVCTSMLYIDVPTAGFTGSITAKVTISYDYWDPVQNRTVAGSLTVIGQMITFGNPTLTTAVHTSTPQQKVLIAGQMDSVISVAFTATGGDITIPTLPVSFLNATAIERVEVYHGLTFIANASSFVGDTVKVPINFAVPNGTTEVLLVKAIPKLVTQGIQSTVPVKATVSNVPYTIPSGDIKVATAARIGNEMYVMRSTQQFDWLQMTGQIQNGVSMNLYGYRVRSVGNSTASKQFTFEVGLVDNSPAGNLLRIKNLGLTIDGVPIPTANLRFTNQNDQVIDSITAADTKVYVAFVVGTHELAIPVGSGKVVRFTGTPVGFTDGVDIIKLRLMIGDPQSSFRYVNSGTAPNDKTVKLGPTQAASGAAMVYNSNWSDISQQSGHSFVIGGGSPDATNGYYLFIEALPYQVWTQ